MCEGDDAGGAAHERRAQQRSLWRLSRAVSPLVLDRLGDVGCGDAVVAGQVGDRPRHLEHAGGRSCCERQVLRGAVQELLAGGVEAADLGEGAGRQVSVEHAAAVAPALPISRRPDPLGHLGGALATSAAPR